MQTPRSVEKEREEVVSAPEHRSPAARGADHGEEAVILQPMESNEGAEIPCSPWRRPNPEQLGWTRAVNPWEAYPEAGSRQGPAVLWKEEPVLEQVS